MLNLVKRKSGNGGCFLIRYVHSFRKTMQYVKHSNTSATEALFISLGMQDDIEQDGRIDVLAILF